MDIHVSDSDLKRVIHFFFEIGMLKKTPRSGFQFLGSGNESVADHTFRVAVIGFSMAKLTKGADPFKVAGLCLFHDVPEARTGDLNYLNERYVDIHEREAIRDLTESLPFAEDMLELLGEYEHGQSLEAELAHDADQLDLILELKQQSGEPASERVDALLQLRVLHARGDGPRVCVAALPEGCGTRSRHCQRAACW